MVLKSRIIAFDEANDIAILKADSIELYNFAKPPYSINNKAPVGTEVLAFGYPLSGLMGNNCKVSKGIINSQSGMRGRFYDFTKFLLKFNRVILVVQYSMKKAD
jgi:hypothetical protein